MRRDYSVDPLWTMVQNRQEELLHEAAYDHLASEARQRLGSDGHPLRMRRKADVNVWRKTAWSLGRVAFSLGGWLLAR